MRKLPGLAQMVNPEAVAMSHDSPLKRAIEALTIPVLWERLRLPGAPRQSD
jgi:hypothetical protein